MSRNNEALVAIATTIVNIMWAQVPVGGWDVAVDQMSDAMVSARRCI